MVRNQNKLVHKQICHIYVALTFLIARHYITFIYNTANKQKNNQENNIIDRMKWKIIDVFLFITKPIDLSHLYFSEFHLLQTQKNRIIEKCCYEMWHMCISLLVLVTVDCAFKRQMTI